MEVNKYKGVVSLEIYGEKRFFKFGTAHMDLFCDLMGTDLENAVTILEDKKNLKAQINFYLAAAISYVRLHNDENESKLKEPTFNQVANWFDSLLDEQREKIAETAFAQAFPNEQAPKQEVLTGQN